MQRSFASLPPSRRASIPTLSISDTHGDVQMNLDSDRPTKKRKVEVQSHASSPIQSSPMEGIETTTLEDEQIRQGSYRRATWIATAYGQSHASLRPGTRAIRSSTLPQTPWTDGNHSEPLPGRIRTPCRYRVDISVPNSPDSLSTPQDAPLLESKRHADYFPWTGGHLEDITTAEVVKAGYWDKAPAPLEKESNTARAPLYKGLSKRDISLYWFSRRRCPASRPN